MTKQTIVKMGSAGIMMLCIVLMTGCAFNKAQLSGDLEERNFDHVFILKGHHGEIARCFITYEKQHMKQAIQGEKIALSALTGSRPTGGRVTTRWDANPFTTNGRAGTRVLCRELESMVLDYRYAADFIQINPGEVRVGFYGRKFTAGWKDMNCGDIVAKMGTLVEASENGDLKAVQALMDRFSDPQAKDVKTDNVGRIAFKHAAENGHADVVQFILERGVTIDAQNVDGTTPLKVACEKGHLEIPPPHGCSFEAKLMGNGSPDNDLIYSLTWP